MTTVASACASSAAAWSRSDLRRGLQRDENFLSLQILALEGDVGLGAGEFAFGLAQGGLINGRVNFRDQLAFFHRRIEVHIQRGNLAGNLAAHIHADHGAQACRWP